MGLVFDRTGREGERNPHELVNLWAGEALHWSPSMTARLPNPSPTDDGGGPEPVLPERLRRDLAGAMRSNAGTTLPASARAALMAEARARAAGAGPRSRWRIGPMPARWVGGLAAAAAVAVVAWVGLTTGPTPPSGTATSGQGQRYAGLPPGGSGAGGSGPAGEGGPMLAGGRLADAEGGKGSAPVTFGVPEGQRGPDVVDVLALARAAAGGAEAADAAPAMLRRLVSLDNFVAAGLGADGVARALAQAGAVGAGGGAAVLGATVSARAGAVLWAGIAQGADTCGTTV